MLHIILTILKILGIILLVFLGIVLAVLLSVLFIPVCYRGQGNKEGEQIEAKASVSWLCYLIHGTVIYESGKTRWELYLFGIPLRKVRDRIKERKRKKSRKYLIHGTVIYESGKTRWELYLFGIPLRKVRDRIKERKRKKSRKAKKTETAKESFPEENPVVALEEKEEEKPERIAGVRLEEKTKEEVSQKEKRESSGVENHKKTEKKQGIWKKMEEKPERIAGVRLEEKTKEEVSQKEKRESSGVENHKKTEKKQGIWKKISEKIKRVRLTFHNICVNIKEWRSFFALETTKAAFRFLLGKGKGLLHHILPRKIRGKLIFGFEDPALTGQVLGVAAIFYSFYHFLLGKGKGLLHHILPRKIRGKLIFGFEDPALTGQVLGVAAIFYSFYQDKFLLTPVFDRQILEGEIKLSGRIYGVYLLWTAWQIYKNQDVRKVYQKFQDKET